jgi:phage terminase large subunit GpA-like protein
MTLVQWADEYRKVAAKTSASPGQWRTNSQPVAFGIMEAVTERDTHTVSVMAGTQVVKTELEINVAGYFIHQDPSPILFVQPNQNAARSFSKERFEPTVEASPVLAALIAPSKSRDSKNTFTHKEYPGGAIDFVGANSPTDLASRPKRVILSDEIDKYPPSAGDEGDPLKLAEERASTYHALGRAKFVRTCSPTSKLTSRIGREYAASDQRKCYLECPHCGEAHVLTWKNVRWGKNAQGEHDPSTARIACSACGVLWTEQDRIAALDALEHRSDFGWRQTRPFTCCGERHVPSRWTDQGRSVCPTCETPSTYGGHAGFQVSKILSKRHRLPNLVQEFLDAVGNPELLKKFTNTGLAELWEEQGEDVDLHILQERARAEAWTSVNAEEEMLASPSGVLVVTCGVDVQGDRLEIERVGWGLAEESWSLDHRVIYGDPSAPEVWSDLDEYLQTATGTTDGRTIGVAATAIDSGGHYTDAVYNFVRDKSRRRVWAIKGQGGEGKPVWPKLASKNNKGKIALFNIGVDSGKDIVYGRLRIAAVGPGYCHFPADRDGAYYEQLTSETVVTRYVKGSPVRSWVPKPNTRQEALDCRVYAFAALRSMSISWGKVQRLLAEQRLAARRREIVEEEVAPAAAVAVTTARSAKRAVSRSAFLSR